MIDFDKIYAPWNGNAEEMARAIGELGVTVRQWRNRGRIGDRYWPKIICAAADRGHVLTLSDFVDHAAPDTPAAGASSHGKTGEISTGAGVAA